MVIRLFVCFGQVRFGTTVGAFPKNFGTMVVVNAIFPMNPIAIFEHFSLHYLESTNVVSFACFDFIDLETRKYASVGFLLTGYILIMVQFVGVIL